MHERSTTTWECLSQPGQITWGRTNLYQTLSVLWTVGTGCFARRPRQRVQLLMCPTNPAALADSYPCTCEPAAPVHTHSVALCLAWSGPRPESCAFQTRGPDQEQGLHPPRCALPNSPGLTAGLPPWLSDPAVYQIKARWLQGPDHGEGHKSRTPLSKPSVILEAGAG